MKFMLRIMPCFFAFLLAGCATLPTTSGNPEIMLTNVKIDCVRSIFLNGLMNQGYTVQNASNTQVVAGKTAEDAPYWYYTFYGGAPEKRVTILFFTLDTPNAFRIVSSAAYVENPATASETVHAIQGTDADQEELMAMQFIIEQQCRK